MLRQHIVNELYLLISYLDDITSTFLSDHILNLFSDLNGTFPEDMNNMLQLLQQFQDFPKEQKNLYQLGRRIGIFTSLKDLDNKRLVSQVRLYTYQMKSLNKTIDQITDKLMAQYI
jgi:hypothetical protein